MTGINIRTYVVPCEEVAVLVQEVEVEVIKHDESPLAATVI